MPWRTLDIVEKDSSADQLLLELAPGELIKDGHFTLFESVSALEVRVHFGIQNVCQSGQKIDQAVDYGPQDGQWLSFRG